MKRRDGASRELRNGGVRAWMENNDLQNFNLASQIAVKPGANLESRKPSRNARHRHQTHVIDKIDRNIEYKMRQKQSRDTDLVQYADQQLNSFLMNNQKSEHRRLMSANSRSRSAALIPKHQRQQPLN